jgi:hypothetical protein
MRKKSGEKLAEYNRRESTRKQSSERMKIISTVLQTAPEYEEFRKRHVERITAFNSLPETREKRSASNRARIARGENPLAKEGVAEKIRLKRIGAKHTDETKEKMSQSRCSVLISRPVARTVPFSSPKQNGDKKFVMNLLELAMIQRMDEYDSVLSFQYEPLQIPYMTEEGKLKHTVPDFLCETVGGTLLAEVKADYSLDKDVVKIEAARKFAEAQGWKYRVFTELELARWYYPLKKERSLILKQKKLTRISQMESSSTTATSTKS